MSVQFGFYDPNSLRSLDGGVRIDFVNAQTGEVVQTTATDVAAIARIHDQIQNQIDHGICAADGSIETMTGRIVTTDGSVPRCVTMIDDESGEFTEVDLNLGGSEGELPRKGAAVLVGTRVGDTFHVFQATVTGVVLSADMASHHGSAPMGAAEAVEMNP